MRTWGACTHNTTQGSVALLQPRTQVQIRSQSRLYTVPPAMIAVISVSPDECAVHERQENERQDELPQDRGEPAAEQITSGLYKHLGSLGEVRRGCRSEDSCWTLSLQTD